MVQPGRVTAVGLACAVVLLAAPGLARGAAGNEGYRIIAGEISYNGAATRSCPPGGETGSCTELGNGARRTSLTVDHRTAAAFSVHGPGLPATDTGEHLVAFAKLDIESWDHTYEDTSTATTTWCDGGVTTHRVSHSDLRHDGGTSPSLYEIGIRINRHAGTNGIDVSLAPAEDTGGVDLGIRYPAHEIASSVLETQSDTSSCPDLPSGSQSHRANLLTYCPFDFYPCTPRDVDGTATSDPPVCDAVKGTCVVRARGTTDWSYGPEYGGDDVRGSMTVTWSVDVEFDSSCENGAPRLRVGNAIAVGCFKRVGRGRYKTTQPAEVGGISLDPAPKLTANTRTGRLGGQAAVRIGSLPLPVAPAGVPTQHPRWELSFETSKAGALLSGMPLSGSLTGKWIDGGEGLEATATVDVEALAARAGLDAVISGNYAARPGGSLTFRSHNGRGLDLRGAEVRIGEVSLLPARWTRFSRRISLKAVKLSYKDADGADEWSGAATLGLPILRAGTPVEVGGRLTIRDGAFAGGGATVNNLNVPLGTSGVFLQGGGLDLHFLPELGLRVAGLGTFGPKVFGEALLEGDIALGLGSLASGCEGADASVDAVVKQGVADGRPFSLEFTGNSCLDVARLAYEVSGGAKVSFPGGFAVEGDYGGWIAAATGTFALTGGSKIRLPGLPDLEGNGLWSDRGVAACGELGWVSAGFGYRWGDRLPEPFRGCDLAAWSSVGTTARGRSGDATARMAAVPVSGTPRLVAFRATAASAAPRLRVTGPDGAIFESPTDPAQVLFDDRVLIFPHPEARQTIAIVRNPAKGEWQVEAADSSAGALSAVETADPLPPVAVRGRLSGRGARRTLHWTAPGAPAGQELHFVEVGTGVARDIGKGTGSSGQVRFRATPAPARGRTVVAQVIQDDLPRASVTIVRFQAPPSLRVKPPRRLRVTVRGGVVRATFKRSRGAALYVLTLQNKSRSIELLAKRPSVRVRRLGWRPRSASVVAVAGDGRRSASSRSRVR